MGLGRLHSRLSRPHKLTHERWMVFEPLDNNVMIWISHYHHDKSPRLVGPFLQAIQTGPVL